jgi:hypothetical protein
MQTTKLFLLLCMSTPCVFGAPPEWLKLASKEILPKYEAAPAVMLHNEQIDTVDDSGEITTIYRGAYRILRPEGKEYGIIRIPFSSETRIMSIKGWSIPAKGEPYEVGEKDTLDTILFSENLYEDTRQKLLKIPASEPGAVIGYEYKQRRQEFILQNQWIFQQEVPVHLARLELRLPNGWSYQEFWVNHPALAAQPAGSNRFVWELRDTPGIKTERGMPYWETLAGQLFLRYIAPGKTGSLASWDEVCQWYAQVTSDRRQSTEELERKVLELTAETSDILAKIRALAQFVQQEVRYVAIVIGAGNYQPHAAEDILKNRYGDCKDKVTLLSTMLAQIRVESYYVLTNTNRGMIRHEFPTSMVFDHVIVAIRMPAENSGNDFFSSIEHPKLGSLLLFDPTSSYTPLGHLPAELQANDGLLVLPSGGGLIALPPSPAAANSLNRTAKLKLKADGDLEGDIEEVRTGVLAAEFRGKWLNSSEIEKKETVQSFFGQQTIGAELSNLSANLLNRTGENAGLSYGFRLARYASSAGGLLLLRPRILEQWSSDIMEDSDRRQPVEFSSPALRKEIIEIVLPDEYMVDELPRPVSAEMGPLAYSSKTEVNGSLLRYSRRLEIKGVRVPLEQLEELKKFFRQMALDEKAKVVLKNR